MVAYQLISFIHMIPDKGRAAIAIQSCYRGFFARKQYVCQTLPIDQQTDYNTWVPGNDPNIFTIPRHRQDAQIALIATSGVRAVHIACELGGKLPKIFLVDNSRHVINYWRYIQHQIQMVKTQKAFFATLRAYCNRVVVSPDDVSEINTRKRQLKEDIRYYTFLFKTFGFQRCQRIIIHASVIAQSWADKPTFQKIKNICEYLNYDKLYAYPSNIVAYLHLYQHLSDAQQVLENIELLQPRLAFHSDLLPSDMNLGGYQPKHIITTGKHVPEYVAKKLGIDLSYQHLLSGPQL